MCFEEIFIMKMPYNYCTLFDKNYLDKGITMIDSLSLVATEYRIFVLTMDVYTYHALNERYKENARIELVNMDSFLNDKLIEAKSNRSVAQFCWTCTASLIQYLFTNYNLYACTYIDSDMYFFRDPSILVDELLLSGKDVQVIEHGFKDDILGRAELKRNGRFCVEFNTFLNNTNGNKVLSDWVDKTIEYCSNEMSDQYYVNQWLDRYDCINIIKNKGAGVAPWNINRYKLSEFREELIDVYCDGEKSSIPLIFYHFENINFYDEGTAKINVFVKYLKVDDDLVNKIYEIYLCHIKRIRLYLKEQFSWEPVINKLHLYTDEDGGKKSKIQLVVEMIGKDFAYKFVYSFFSLLNKSKDFISF